MCKISGCAQLLYHVINSGGIKLDPVVLESDSLSQTSFSLQCAQVLGPQGHSHLEINHPFFQSPCTREVIPLRIYFIFLQEGVVVVRGGLSISFLLAGNSLCIPG